MILKGTGIDNEEEVVQFLHSFSQKVKWDKNWDCTKGNGGLDWEQIA